LVWPDSELGLEPGTGSLDSLFDSSKCGGDERPPGLGLWPSSAWSASSPLPCRVRHWRLVRSAKGTMHRRIRRTPTTDPTTAPAMEPPSSPRGPSADRADSGAVVMLGAAKCSIDDVGRKSSAVQLTTNVVQINHVWRLQATIKCGRVAQVGEAVPPLRWGAPHTLRRDRQNHKHEQNPVPSGGLRSAVK
jgi:hypothetical protein